MKIFLLLIIAFVFFPICYSQQKIVLEGAILIDGTGKEPISSSIIVIDGKRIIEVGIKGKIKIPNGAKKINLKGKYIIPGLIDTYSLYYSPRDYIQMLAWGVTSANCVFESTEDALQIQNRSAGDSVHSPQVYITAPVFTNQPSWFWNREFEIDSTVNQFPETPEEAKEQIRKVKEKGIERINIIYDSMDWCREPLLSLGQINKDVAVVLIREGRANNFFMFVSTASVINAVDIVDYGPSAFIHGILDFHIDKPLANAMQGRNIFYVPTFCLFDLLSDIYGFVQENLSKEKFKLSLPDDIIIQFSNPDYYNQMREKYPNAKYIQSNLDKLQFNLKKFLKNSVVVTVGSGIWIFPGISTHLEIENLVNAGMNPLQVLTSATFNGAKFLGEDKNIGTIEKGKQANLVILNSDPLKDIKNTRDIMQVVKHGVIFDPEVLINEAKR